MLQIKPKNITSVTEARANLNKMITQAQKDKVSLLTKQGKPAVVLVDPDYFSRVQESIERVKWAKEFNLFLDEAKTSFKKYLTKNGYKPEKLTDEKIEKIIKEI